MINLENNNIAGFDKSVFSNPGSVTTLAIGDNPLHCDCRLSWVASMVKRQDMMENTDAQCMTPPHLQDRYLQHVPHYSLVCTGDHVDPVQARCDPCYAQPCYNGGRCISMISNIQSHYVCECSSLYTGDRCQVSIHSIYIIYYYILSRPWLMCAMITPVVMEAAALGLTQDPWCVTV